MKSATVVHALQVDIPASQGSLEQFILMAALRLHRALQALTV